MKQKNKSSIAERKAKNWIQNNLYLEIQEIKQHLDQGLDLEIIFQDPDLVYWIEVKASKLKTKTTVRGKEYTRNGCFRLRKDQHRELREKDGMYCFLLYKNKEELKEDKYYIGFKKPGYFTFNGHFTRQPNWAQIFPDQKTLIKEMLCLKTTWNGGKRLNFSSRGGNRIAF